MVTLAAVEITNIKVIEHLRIETGVLTVISGENGSGKSSILDAISTIFEGGHDPALIRHEADKGEVVLELNDATTIRKVITAKGYTLTVKTKDGGIVKAPAKYVERLAAGFALDPIAFVTAKKAERVKFLLEAMPIEFTAEETRKILGEAAPVTAINLQRLGEIRDGLFEGRREVNVIVRDMEGSIKDARKNLPPEPEGDPQAKVSELTETIAKLREEMASAKADLDAQSERLKSEKRTECEAKILELQRALAYDVQDINKEARKVYEQGTADAHTSLETATSELATAKAAAETQHWAKGARANLKQMETRCREKFIRSNDLTQKLTAVDKLKASKLANLPIPGIDIQDGDVAVENVPWEHVNSSEQWLVAIQVGSLKTGELGLMVCDNAEGLDPKRWEEFTEAITASGLQVAVARATAGDLKVESA